MEEEKLYNLDSAEFYELIDSSRVRLKNKDEKYKNISDEIENIRIKYPNINSLFEDEKVTNLTEEECINLQKIIKKYLIISSMKEREIFFLGARENYYYLKNLDLLKD